MSEKEAKLTGAENVAWNLGDLYAGTDDPKIDKDMEEALARADALTEKYKGRVADLDAGELYDLVAEYEALNQVAYHPGAYAFLHWSTNTADAARGALRQKTSEFGAALQQKLVWFDLEWAAVLEEKAKALIDDKKLAPYRHFLTISRLRRPYLLTEPEEKILAEKSVTGRTAWARFFNEVHSAARFEWDGQEVPIQNVLTQLFNPDRDVRIKAAESVTKTLKDISRTTSYIFNTVLADKFSDDKLRGFPTWVSARNLDNQVDDDSVMALVNAVTARYDIVARYYKLKAKLLGLDELFDYDRYAPLPAAEDDYSWEEGKETVLKAYGDFHPRLAEIVQEFFDKNWIDAPVREGKMSGAYSAGLTPVTHPYIFLNFEGKSRDVMTLAHELGHGMHQYLSREQGLLESDTPLTTAETASTFGEMLVFNLMMSQQEDPKVRLAMLTAKIEDSFATIFRQIAMNRFEDAIHTARREQGELTGEQFNEFWLQTQRDMFQDSMTMTDNYGYWWSYVNHFIDYPGYVYAYSFGELLVMALYARYQEVGEGFAEDYIAMLTAGGSDWPHEIVKPLGVDLTDPDFWKQGLQILSDMVTQAEELAAEIG